MQQASIYRPKALLTHNHAYDPSSAGAGSPSSSSAPGGSESTASESHPCRSWSTPLNHKRQSFWHLFSSAVRKMSRHCLSAMRMIAWSNSSAEGRGLSLKAETVIRHPCLEGHRVETELPCRNTSPH
ncbi:unnamed protein product [Ectocarpus sp. 8 AP-2014]